jgi:hypothetical protein
LEHVVDGTRFRKPGSLENGDIDRYIEFCEEALLGDDEGNTSGYGDSM